MLETEGHQQMQVSSGVLDLTFAWELRGGGEASVKSTPLAPRIRSSPPLPHPTGYRALSGVRFYLCSPVSQEEHRSRQLKPSFNKLRPKLLPAPEKSAPPVGRRGKKDRIRHGKQRFGEHRFGIHSLPGRPPRRTQPSLRRNPSLLRCVLCQGFRSLPAGTALHARTGPGLPRQAGST
jgi:hypothetical protein